MGQKIVRVEKDHKPNYKNKSIKCPEKNWEKILCTFEVGKDFLRAQKVLITKEQKLINWTS